MYRLIVLFIFISNSIWAQSNDSLKFQNKNSVQLELGGHGAYYSVCYERILLNGERFKTAMQSGIAYYPPKTGIIDLWVPIVVNEIISFDKHHLEIGIGYIFINEAIRLHFSDNPIFWERNHFITGRIGYRYQKPDGRLILRAGFTPILDGLASKSNLLEFHPWAGATVGYSF